MWRRSTIVAWTAVLVATQCAAQQRDVSRSPFLVGAVSSGVAGFTEGGSAHALLGGYAYAAYPRLLLGVQGGASPGGGTPDLIYGIATLGYPARSIRQSLVYPFVGVGAGVLHSGIRPRNGGLVFGAGVGADRMVREKGRGLLVGVRGGYLYRQGDVGERVVFLGVALGAGGRRRVSDEPPVIVAARCCPTSGRGTSQ
jgi:hypothetical protein